MYKNQIVYSRLAQISQMLMLHASQLDKHDRRLVGSGVTGPIIPPAGLYPGIL